MRPASVPVTWAIQAAAGAGPSSALVQLWLLPAMTGAVEPVSVGQSVRPPPLQVQHCACGVLPARVLLVEILLKGRHSSVGSSGEEMRVAFPVLAFCAGRIIWGAKIHA